MFIRNTRFNRSRLRASLLLYVLAISVISCVPSALAQDLFYEAELLGAARYDAQKMSSMAAEPMSFSEAEDRLRQHPSLDALSLTAKAHRNRAEAALGLPDPVVSLQLNNVPLLDPSFSEYLPSNKAVGIRQALPSRAERKANALKSLRSAAQQDAVREQHYKKLRGELLVYLIEKQSLALQREFALARQAKYDALTDIIDIEITAGRPVVFRLAQVAAQRTDVSRTLSELGGQDAQINAELINLLGVIPKTVVPTLSKSPWGGNALRFHGVRVADADVDISDAEVQKTEADFKPDWGVNLTYQQRESGQGARSNFDGEDWVSGGVNFTLPLWAGKRQQPNLRAAKYDRDARIAQRTAIARQLKSEWSRYDARRQAASENAQILRQKIEAIKAQAASQLIAYESGRGDYSPILDADIAVLMLRSEIIKENARRDQMIAKMNSLLVTT